MVIFLSKAKFSYFVVIVQFESSKSVVVVYVFRVQLKVFKSGADMWVTSK